MVEDREKHREETGTSRNPISQEHAQRYARELSCNRRVLPMVENSPHVLTAYMHLTPPPIVHRERLHWYSISEGSFEATVVYSMFYVLFRGFLWVDR